MAEEQWKSTGYAEVAKALQGVTIAVWMAAMACLAIPGWQIYVWLRFGFWQPITNADGLTYLSIQAPHADWVGVQSVIEWWLAQSFAGWLFATLLFAGFLTLWLGLLADSAELALKHTWQNDGWKRKMASRPPDPPD